MHTTCTTHSTHGYMLAAALVAAVLFAPNTTHAQNLVPNPGFEDTDSCTFGLGLGELHHWYSAYLTPDHLQSCLPYGSANGLPLNIFTFQYPYEGNSCAGIFTFDGHTGNEWREWLMVPLLDALFPGQIYYCSFRANAAFEGNGWNPVNCLASSNVGMLFTTYDRPWNWGDPYPAALNQAHIFYPQILSDTVGWTLISGSFVADSAYRYIVLGNFFSDALTDTVHLSSESSWAAYYFYDAICVSPTPGECPMATGIAVQDHMAVQVGLLGGGQWLRVEGAPVGSSGWAYDAGGRVLAQWMMQPDGLLNIGNWAEGLYVVRIAGPGMTAWSGNFVVMR